MIAKPYFYNSVNFITEEDESEAKRIAIEKLDSYIELLNDYDLWKSRVKSFNKFIYIKHYKKDYSRYAWHQEVSRAKDKRSALDTAKINELITTAYNDSFYHKDILYYPVEYPQIFRIALATKTINQIYTNSEEAIKQIEVLPETCVLGATDEDKIEWKEISDNISEFFHKYPNGLMYISNGN